MGGGRCRVSSGDGFSKKSLPWVRLRESASTRLVEKATSISWSMDAPSRCCSRMERRLAASIGPPHCCFLASSRREYEDSRLLDFFPLVASAPGDWRRRGGVRRRGGGREGGGGDAVLDEDAPTRRFKSVVEDFDDDLGAGAGMIASGVEVVAMVLGSVGVIVVGAGGGGVIVELEGACVFLDVFFVRLEGLD